MFFTKGEPEFEWVGKILKAPFELNLGVAMIFYALGILAPIAATVIQLAISRSREYIADSTGAKLVMNGESLAKALEKLHEGNKSHPLMFGTDATNHLMIISPFRGAGRAFVNLFSTHPDYKERCKRLRALNF